MAKLTQIVVDKFGRPYATLNVIAGPFTHESHGYSTQFVVVRCSDETSLTRSVIQVRSGRRIGRVAVSTGKGSYESRVKTLLLGIESGYGSPEVRKRLETARDIPKPIL